jgi:hypothetical protein
MVTGIAHSIFVRNYATIIIEATKAAKDLGMTVSLKRPNDTTRNSRYIEIKDNNKTILTIRHADHKAGANRPNSGRFLDLSAVKMINGNGGIKETVLSMIG